MNRRSFVKWLLAGIALIAASGSVFMRKLLDGGTPPLSAAEAPTPEAAQPTAAPASTPTPASSPSPVEKGKLLATVFLLSDIHMIDSQPVVDKVHTALKDLTSLKETSDAIVLGGDLTTYARELDYKLLRTTFNSYKLPPLYGNMGNHEYYDIWLTKEGAWSTETVPNGKTDKGARNRFQKFMGMDKPYADAWVNGVHLIMVSQEAYVQEKPDVQEGAWYSDEQLAWLEETLKPHADGSPALIFIHQPLPAIGSEGGNHRLIRASEFRRILLPYPNLFVFSGHTHQDLNLPNRYTKESFHWFMNASVTRTRGELSQGLLIQVYEGAVDIRGREFSRSEWIAAADWSIPLVG